MIDKESRRHRQTVFKYRLVLVVLNFHKAVGAKTEKPGFL